MSKTVHTVSIAKLIKIFENATIYENIKTADSTQGPPRQILKPVASRDMIVSANHLPTSFSVATTVSLPYTVHGAAIITGRTMTISARLAMADSDAAIIIAA